MGAFPNFQSLLTVREKRLGVYFSASERIKRSSFYYFWGKFWAIFRQNIDFFLFNGYSIYL
ncbi:MAG: hypothetical protein B5M54_00835 [Candidatus Aminicenantes bacterium 4484_214]|nr:MAG: hypothetical protein B5M54_00835 [Candidatus Aminicenantes bacterium 4484_214]RLE11000.1 MAG: hypothetical protein DRJ06_00100 [Candidatus Aminicenantes bacterium]